MKYDFEKSFKGKIKKGDQSSGSIPLKKVGRLCLIANSEIIP